MGAGPATMYMVTGPAPNLDRRDTICRAIPIPEFPVMLWMETEHGQIHHGDCLDVLRSLPAASVDLVVTSPPYALVSKKPYGNVSAAEYVDWFRPFGTEIHRVLRDTGSFVLNIGGVWTQGLPTRSLYHYRLLIDLVDTVGFHLAQDLFWWSPSKLPGARSG